eukprot:scaffold28778_cov62-Phaeocystis_antarctica.AAC.4
MNLDRPECSTQPTPPVASNHNTSRPPRTPCRRSARPSASSAGGKPPQARRRARTPPASKITPVMAGQPEPSANWPRLVKAGGRPALDLALAGRAGGRHC